VQATVANWALEARFSDWLSNPNIRSGLPMRNIV
jgi:glycine betaine/proline transport system permease protein